jgi:hypothetical protein
VKVGTFLPFLSKNEPQKGVKIWKFKNFPFIIFQAVGATLWGLLTLES